MGAKRTNLGTRLVALENQVLKSRPSGPPVTVYLPIKDGEERAPGTEVWPGGATVVWYATGPATGPGQTARAEV